MKKNPIISLAIFGLLSVTTQAETLNEGLVKCAKIEDSLARLVCFDRLADHTSMPVSTVVKSNKVMPVAKPTVEAPVKVSKAESFGADHIRKSHEVEKEESKIVFEIASLQKDPYGKYRFTFKNGQQWKQTDNNQLRVKVGESVLLSKGFMGSIFLKKNDTDSNKKIRVKRLK
ncbi:hypothetical protein EKO29_19930 [Colwellia sp. Arc7-635]|jgi:hypothetical protein|uniref:hypothetical protein n=1 Tax=Colwellia sp. Arc7-635 TaxID=2497879 RepID=UPI000F8509F8|nr:hypothetical protein [Colwellia sp. Arc7-635]AZQ86061.1 hypothetical protein EKO29_19930 [Colwellia sp. Arc7-635]